MTDQIEIKKVEGVVEKGAAGRERFVGHANLMAGLTVVSRVFGLVRDKACSIYLGNKTTAWSAFWMGFQLPNLSRRIFGEGALTAIFVPTYTRVLEKQGREAADRLASATSTLLVVVLGALTVIGEMVVLPVVFGGHALAANRLAAAMIAVMLPYCVMVCLVALFGAIATVHEKFTAQSVSPIILNVLMTLGAAVPVWVWSKDSPREHRIYWVACAVVVAGILQVGMMLPTLRRSGVRLRAMFDWRESGVGEIVKAMLPMVLGLSAVQFNTFMDTQIGWWLSPDGHAAGYRLWGHGLPLGEGAVGILSVAQRIYLLPVGIFGVSMATAIFPLLSSAAAKGDVVELKRLVVSGLRKTLFLSLPATVGMMLIARPLIALLYSPEGLDRATWAAIWFCAGIWAFEAQMVILRAFYALNDRITPVKVAVGMVVLNFSLNITLVWWMQEGGLALSTTVSAVVQSGILLWILRGRVGRLGLGSLAGFVGKAGLASLLMGAAVLGVLWVMPEFKSADHSRQIVLNALVRLPVVVAAAGLVYGMAAVVMGMEDLKHLPVVGKWFGRGKWHEARGARG